MVSMNVLRNWLRRVRYYLKHDFLTVENVVLFLAIVLCLAWTYQSIMAMSRNWELSEKLTTEKKELELLTIENEAAELENEYYRSSEHQELMARKYMDKQLPGEKMVILPENSEEARNRHRIVEQAIEEKVDYSNYDKWMNFLFPKY